MDFKVFIFIGSFLPLFSGEDTMQKRCAKTGENVYLDLTTNVTKNDIEWKQSQEKIATSKRCFKSSAKMFLNGTLMLSNVQKNWTGNITAQGFNDGTHKFTETHHLVVLDSPVVKLIGCAEQASLLYCLGENGPEALYNWTVRDSVLGEERTFYGKHLFLKDLSGAVLCTVEKDGCAFQSDPLTLSCPEPQEKTSQDWCLNAVTGFAVLLFFLLMALLLLLFLFCSEKGCKQDRANVKPEERDVSLQMRDDDVIYSDVRAHCKALNLASIS